MAVLKRWDPRVLAIKYPFSFTLIFIGFWALNILWNYRVLNLRGDILADALPSYDRYKQMDDLVRSQPDFNASEADPVIVFCPELTTACLQSLLDTQKELEDGGYNTASLVDIPEYVDTGERLEERPYIDQKALLDFNPEMFRRRVLQDLAIRGTFTGKDLGWYAIGVLPPSPDESERERSWKMIEILEGRNIPWWERLYKTDIRPKSSSVSVTGWTKGRFLIDQCLNVDMIILPFFGVSISFFVLYWLLGSLRQAAIATVVSVLSGIWFTRGAITPIHDYLTPSFFEIVYTILAYGNIIVQGISLPLHKISAFREASGNSKDRLLTAQGIDGKIFVIALIATATFLASNLSFPIHQLRLMGWQSIVGVVAVYVTTTVFIPAVYLVTEKCLGPERLKALKPIQFLWYERSVPYFRLSPKIALGATAATFVAAACLFFFDMIPARTVPWNYITGTEVWRTFDRLKAMGDGNEFVSLYVSPRSCGNNLQCAGSITQKADFLRSGWLFQNDLRNGMFEEWQRKGQWKPFQVIAVSSVLDKVAEISRASYREAFPVDDEMADEIFVTLVTSTKPALRKWLWNKNGFRISVADNMNESDVLAEFIRRIELYATTFYPDIQVLPFGKVPAFTRVDYYVDGGLGQDIIFSIAIIVLAYWLWIKKQPATSRYLVRPFATALILLTPFLFGAGNMGIIMWWLEIPLSMSTAPIFSLTVNAGNDFSVYMAAAYLSWLLADHDPEEAALYAAVCAGVVVMIDAILNIIAFFPLTVSQFGPIREIGWMMSGMLLSCLVGAIIFVPALLPLATKELTTQKEVSHEEARACPDAGDLFGRPLAGTNLRARLE